MELWKGLKFTITSKETAPEGAISLASVFQDDVVERPAQATGIHLARLTNQTPEFLLHKSVTRRLGICCFHLIREFLTGFQQIWNSRWGWFEHDGYQVEGEIP